MKSWMMRVHSRLQIVLFIVTAALASSRAGGQTTRPAVTDAHRDKALATAAAQEDGTEKFASALQSVALAFREVTPTTEPGKSAWHKVTLNARGKRVDAIRFRVPEGKPRDLLWAFFPPENFAGWYIIPVVGKTEGFTRIGYRSTRALPGATGPAGADTVYLQSLPARHLKPGSEYIIWFRLDDEKPGPLHLAIALLPAAANADAFDDDTVVKALGLTTKSEKQDVVDLDAPATQPASR